MQKHKLHTTLLVLCILYSQVSTTTGNARVIPGVTYTNNAFACKEAFHQLDSHAPGGDNGSCGCERYCASDWGGRLSGRGWRGATNMILGSNTNCMCVEAKEPGWCDIDTAVCESKCHAGHDFSAGNPCKPYPNPCPGPNATVPPHPIRYLEPGSDLYYCMDGLANMCSINASKPGPNGPGSAWGSVHPPCFPPVDSSSCSWPGGATVAVSLVSIIACVAVVFALWASKDKPPMKRCLEACQKQMGRAQESTSVIEPGVGVEQGLFSYL